MISGCPVPSLLALWGARLYQESESFTLGKISALKNLVQCFLYQWVIFKAFKGLDLHLLHLT